MCLGQGVQGKGRRGRLAVKGSPQEPLPITPMICHWPVPCHVLGTLVKKAGSVFVQIVVLTVMKDGGGVGLCHTPRCSFYWTSPWSETQGSNASAETTDPFARALHASQSRHPQHTWRSDSWRSPDQ